MERTRRGVQYRADLRADRIGRLLPYGFVFCEWNEASGRVLCGVAAWGVTAPPMTNTQARSVAASREICGKRCRPGEGLHLDIPHKVKGEFQCRTFLSGKKTRATSTFTMRTTARVSQLS